MKTSKRELKRKDPAANAQKVLIAVQLVNFKKHRLLKVPRFEEKKKSRNYDEMYINITILILPNNMFLKFVIS